MWIELERVLLDCIFYSFFFIEMSMTTLDNAYMMNMSTDKRDSPNGDT